MDVALAIRQRLQELGLEQRALAAAAEVTESYISQLLAGKKLPPSPERTDIYEKMGRILKLPPGRLAELATLRRKEELKKALGDTTAPLFHEVRGLILRKCPPAKRTHIASIFEKQPFGELERLVTQKLLDVVKEVAREELESENWLRLVARLSGRSYEEMRVTVLDFLDADVMKLSPENCASFLDPLIESWDIDLATFRMQIVLNRRLVIGGAREFEFVERPPGQPPAPEPGLQELFRDPILSIGVTPEEAEFLKGLRFSGRRPTALYYYRELQNLRDPLHFNGAGGSSVARKIARSSRREGSSAPMHKHREAAGIEDQLQHDGRSRAIQRWTRNKPARARRARAKKKGSI
jgi:transcriptional regulator with XRE-family HTH domain